MSESKLRRNADGTYKFLKGSDYKDDQMESRVRSSGYKLMKYGLLRQKKVRSVSPGE